MKYLIVQEWANTKGNHAGMKHMCELLCEKYPDMYTMIVSAEPEVKKESKNYFISRLSFLRRKYFTMFYNDIVKYKKYYDTLCLQMFSDLKNGDEVFLLEYILPEVSQRNIALRIKKDFPFVRVYGLSHLTPKYFNAGRSYLGVSNLKGWVMPLDKLMTLGSSLSSFFVNKGINSKKISTGFHYVDHEYYYPINNFQKKSDKTTVIVIGALQRNFLMLSEIVKATTSVNWIICRGRKNVDYLFFNCNNVELHGYLEENELRLKMSEADLSLNVLDDTVGSNVITTSMAMGLGIIVSDVGSIHDYCSDQNAVFCQNSTNSFVNAINALTNNPERIAEMKKASFDRSKDFHIEKVHQWFCSLSKS